MKYMLMMNTPERGEYGILSWPKQALDAHMAFMMNFNKKLVASGEFVEVNGLSSPAQAKLVKAGKDGKPVTDGVFPESKEFLAGYWIVDVSSAERAYQVAAEASLAPGIDGKPLYTPIEVRPIGVAPKN
jgi:hypothetical protein